MKDIMLDLETLGTRHNAVIISIGACYFNRDTGEIGGRFSVNVNPDRFGDKFTMDYETVKWWFAQSQAARDSAMSDPIGLDEALRRLNSFVTYKDDVVLWSHATFDVPILMNAFDTLGIKFAVPYRNTRDLRTLMDLADHRSETPREGTHHNALDDATFQATYAAEAFRKLKHGAA